MEINVLAANIGLDELRVLTVIPAPGAVFLGVIGLAAVGWMKRRFA